MGRTAAGARRERERLRKRGVKQKEERWLNRSPAQLQREQEYMDWTLTRPEQARNAPRNDTFEIFVAERRFAKEKERLRRVEERRTHERREKRLLADAATSAPPEPARGAPVMPPPAAAHRPPQQWARALRVAAVVGELREADVGPSAEVLSGASGVGEVVARGAAVQAAAVATGAAPQERKRKVKSGEQPPDMPAGARVKLEEPGWQNLHACG